jgi:hypothetical protein
LVLLLIFKLLLRLKLLVKQYLTLSTEFQKSEIMART